MTRVSVVMAACDAEQWIGDAIESVRRQTYLDWELVVVDDGSTDSTRELVHAIGDERIRLLERPHRGVLAAVRNDGIAEAKGELVALLDADDVWEPEKLERQVGELERSADVGLVHTGAYLLIEGRRREAPPQRLRGPSTLESLLTENSVYSSSVVVRRSLLDRFGAFDPDPALFGSPDYELWLRLTRHTAFAHVPEPLVGYRVHPSQMSVDVAAMERSALAAIERVEPSTRRERQVLLRARGMRKCRGRLPGRGRRELLQAAWLRPGDPLAWRWLLRSLVPQRPSAAA
jgi:glycosyltransferase involved in cell wall biosynthesis